MRDFCPKTYFATEKEALNYIEILKKTSCRDKIPKRAYLCQDCLTWHLTSQDKDISAIFRYRQKINQLQKMLAEKNNIIHNLRRIK